MSQPDPSEESLEKSPETEVLRLEIRPIHLALRIAAFLFDFALIIALFILLLTKIVLPVFQPAFLESFNRFIAEQSEIDPAMSLQEMMTQQMEFQKDHEEEFALSSVLYVLIVWAYFVLSEFLMKGASLGKKIFKFQVIDLKTLSAPGAQTILLRNCIKTLSIAVFPILIFVNLLYPMFNRRRQAGHDAIAKTMVIHENDALLLEESLQR